MKLYRKVTKEEADRTLTTGFEDKVGTYLTDREFSGVWVSDRPLDANEGLPLNGHTLLQIDLSLPESEIADYEWIEEGKSYREWLIPARVLNENARVSLSSTE